MPSKVIRFCKYDEARRELTVHFVSGRCYVYLQVPPAIAEGLKEASSKGAYFNAHVRDRFPHRELESATR